MTGLRLRLSRGSVLAFRTQVRGFKPVPKPSDFPGRKKNSLARILSEGN
jgi:hypothetical protein